MMNMVSLDREPIVAGSQRPSAREWVVEEEREYVASEGSEEDGADERVGEAIVGFQSRDEQIIGGVREARNDKGKIRQPDAGDVDPREFQRWGGSGSGEAGRTTADTASGIGVV